MKVVLFCGGFGMRLREQSESMPKPLVKIGYRPMLWHIMKYYAHHGHKEFILCLGWKGNEIKEYFLDYNECMSNDFVLRGGGSEVELLNRDIDDWNITFVDTGPSSNVGERLRAAKQHVAGEETFLANYTDGLSNAPLPDLIDLHQSRKAIASFVSVRPRQSFHTVAVEQDGRVGNLSKIEEADVWMNGGFFVLSKEIFDYIEPGEDLVAQPFERLIAARRLCTLRHDDFWSCMDTYKEMQDLKDMYDRGVRPWEVWKLPTQTPETT